MATTTQATGPTLTQITRVGRGVVKYGLIVAVVYMVGRMLLLAGIAYWKATHPDPPPPPTVGFGLLPAVRFPASETRPTTYTLETANGSLPDFGDRAKVFFMPRRAVGLFTDQQARAIADVYGFNSEPEILDPTTYRWSRLSPLFTTFTLDVRDNVFSLKTDYLSRTDLLGSQNLPTNFDAVARVKGFAALGESLQQDIASASGQVSYKKSLGGELADAVSASDADFVVVDLNRVPVDTKYEMFTPGGTEGIIHAVITGALGGDNSIVDLENRYRAVDYTQVHTYPLRSAQDAWKALQAGEGVVINPGSGETAVVREVQLGYYDDFEYQEYLQPIYVFTGDNQFMAYVSALPTLWWQTGQPAVE